MLRFSVITHVIAGLLILYSVSMKSQVLAMLKKSIKMSNVS